MRQQIDGCSFRKNIHILRIMVCIEFIFLVLRFVSQIPDRSRLPRLCKIPNRTFSALIGNCVARPKEPSTKSHDLSNAWMRACAVTYKILRYLS